MARKTLRGPAEARSWVSIMMQEMPPTAKLAKLDADDDAMYDFVSRLHGIGLVRDQIIRERRERKTAQRKQQRKRQANSAVRQKAAARLSNPRPFGVAKICAV